LVQTLNLPLEVVMGITWMPPVYTPAVEGVKYVRRLVSAG
jgi:hypothetical protein